MGSLRIDSDVAEAITSGVGGWAAAVWVARSAALAAAPGSSVMVGAGVGDAGGDRVAAGVGKVCATGSLSGALIAPAVGRAKPSPAGTVAMGSSSFALPQPTSRPAVMMIPVSSNRLDSKRARKGVCACA